MDGATEIKPHEAFGDSKNTCARPIMLRTVFGAIPQSNVEDGTGGKVKAYIQYGVAAASLALMCLGIAGCGNSVSGHTYSAPGGMVKIEFQSGGKAMTSMGPMSSNCTYTQSGAKVELTCEGDTTELTVASDGSLTGPPDGMLAKLTKAN
jgi:hypothetical protein